MKEIMIMQYEQAVAESKELMKGRVELMEQMIGDEQYVYDHFEVTFNEQIRELITNQKRILNEEIANTIVIEKRINTLRSELVQEMVEDE